ncbi:manganese efflux pump MntP family protein [Spirochaetota bacterium]
MFFTYFLVGLGLTMDAFAVSVSSGMCIKDLKTYEAFRASLFFGLFQFGMPIMGWYLGSSFSVYIKELDHFIAFGLLSFIGDKMIYDAIRSKSRAACDDEAETAKIRSINTLLILSVATSIDALAVGLGYACIGAPILVPAIIIGMTTFTFCLFGFEFGRRIGSILKEWAEIAGGIVLIVIGLKILLEHLLM